MALAPHCSCRPGTPCWEAVIRNADDSAFPATLDADVAIIGAGAAGLALALALAKSRLSVVVLAGGGETEDPVTQALYDGEIIGAPYTPLTQIRSRQFGGTTSQWEGWCHPLQQNDLSARGWIDNSGWPIKASDLEPFMEGAAALAELGGAGFDYGALSQIAAQSGSSILPVIHGGVETRLVRGSPPTRFGTRYRAELDAARNVTVWLGLSAAGFEMSGDGTRIAAVRYARIEGRQGRLRARHVVMAAGGIENARLMLSAEPQLSPAMGDSFWHVGRHFSDHPLLDGAAFLLRVRGEGVAPGLPAYDGPVEGAFGRARFALAPSPLLMAREGIASSLTFIRPSAGTLVLSARGGNAVQGEAAEVLPDARLAAAAAQAAFPLAREMDVHPLTGLIETRSRSDSRITLSDARDRLGLAKPRLDWRIGAQDIADYVTTLVHLARDMAATGTGLVYVHPEAARIFAGNFGHAGHHMGTTRMAADPARGVTDANGKVFGIGNLWCQGSSLFCTPGATYPTLTILAMALRLADAFMKGTA